MYVYVYIHISMPDLRRGQPELRASLTYVNRMYQMQQLTSNYNNNSY